MHPLISECITFLGKALRFSTNQNCWNLSLNLYVWYCIWGSALWETRTPMLWLSPVSLFPIIHSPECIPNYIKLCWEFLFVSGRYLILCKDRPSKTEGAFRITSTKPNRRSRHGSNAYKSSTSFTLDKAPSPRTVSFTGNNSPSWLTRRTDGRPSAFVTGSA